MKELTKMSRLAASLERIFTLINNDWFNGELDTPVITVQSTPRAYGHVTVSDSAWMVKGTGKRELNIGAGTLDRDIDCTVATMMHECCHIYSMQHDQQDTSRGNTYHNKVFKSVAEAHGLTVEHSDKYGWSHTKATDELIEWILEKDITPIMLNRNEYSSCSLGRGGNAPTSGAGTPVKKKSSTRRYRCPCCGQTVRATKTVYLICGICKEQMIEG